MAIKDDMEDVQEAVINELISDNGLNPLTVGDGEITTAKIADGAVGTAKIADSSITAAKLAVSFAPAQGSLSTGQLADDAVTRPKIADGAVTLAKLGSDVDLGQVNNGAVTPAKLSQAYLPLTGGSVTGTVTADGLTVGAKAFVTADANVGYFGGDAAQTNHISFYDALDLVRIYTAGSEAMRIDSSGNVGIGTSSITRELELWNSDSTTYGSTTRADAGANQRIFNTSNTNSVYAGLTLAANNGGSTTSEFTIANVSTSSNYLGDLVFQARTGASSYAERMRISSSGNVLVGCTSPPSASVTGSGFSATTLGRRILSMSSSSTGGGVQLATFFNPNGQVGGIATSGSSTSYNTSSDYRLKTDAQPMTGASARLKALNPVNFEWIADGTRVDGFLAHEAATVVPEAVSGDKDALDEEGNPEYQGIDQSKLVPLLTAALQEALTKIEALEVRITNLEA